MGCILQAGSMLADEVVLLVDGLGNSVGAAGGQSIPSTPTAFELPGCEYSVDRIRLASDQTQINLVVASETPHKVTTMCMFFGNYDSMKGTPLPCLETESWNPKSLAERLRRSSSEDISRGAP